ncbi:aminopeptidase N-like [Battus philenor]|uniref:aminopeptidase N-like n=1 Tax=Battus philenor TaxID=42288 RepID=UPI0035CEDDBF
MSLSTSRQQFLAYETHGAEDIHYGRKGGIFISTCICVFFIVFAVIFAFLVGIIVYFVTYFKVSQTTQDYWDETEFGYTKAPSPDLRLPPYVLPSFYRLKIKADIEKSVFSGEVYITIRANKKVNEIILHSKNLVISKNAKLTEQIYEQETIHMGLRKRREINITEPIASDNITTYNVTENSFTSSYTDNIQENVTTNPLNDVHITTIDMQVAHTSVRNITILTIKESTGDRLMLTLDTPLRPGVDYILKLPFEGNISNSLTGFYKSTYTTSKNEVRKLGVTQFQPTSARAAFPCFDEPAFKAKFEISIAHTQNLTVLSNMKVYAEEPIKEEPGWQWTHFDRSVNMSTYLVAYTITDFQYLETKYTSKDNVTKPIKIWTRPELIHKAKYALNITPKLLEYYEDVFGLPYALDKLDLIAVPDFSSGAMENWGLITFRETTLLFDKNENVPRDKQSVAIDIAHELAHQWFGNLVTMKWWTDLWLNEGFATYIEYVGVDHIEPEWNMFESFTQDKMNLLRSDALKNTSPVSRQVTDASEISQKFDEISYTKGANLIRMLNHTISEELFHKGLTIYLNNWKYSNAVENDLWQAMDDAMKGNTTLQHLSIVDFMNTWTRQPGYPVVKVERNYETGQVHLSQNLFTSNNDPYKNMEDQLWHIPISFTTMDVPKRNWTTRPRIWLNDRTASADLNINDTQALYVNIDAIGYYRVNYDKKNWELLNHALKTGTFNTPITKAQLIDDAFNFAKSDQLEYSYALGLTTCVIEGEDSKIVWDLILNNMAFLKHNLRSTSGYIYFQDYMKIILSKQLQRLNYGLDKPKDDNEAFLIENLVLWECLVESPRCLDWARDQFQLWSKQEDLTNNPIPSYLRSLVYNMVVKHGGRREFEFFWNLFQNSSDPSVKSMAITVLPSTRQESLISLLLERSLTEIPKQYAVAVWSFEPPIATRIAQDFLIENFDRVYDMFTQMDAFMFPAVLGGAFGFITTVDELNKLKSFAKQHKEKLMPMSQTLQKIVDSAELRIKWVKKHAKEINHWFKEYVTGNATKLHTDVNESPSEPLLTQNITFTIPNKATDSSTVLPTNVTENDSVTSKPSL